ncbi:MAG: hypothetical protein ACK5UX_02860 [Burkholderiales bacterium]
MIKFASAFVGYSILLVYVAATHASDKPAVQEKMADSIELVDQGCRHAAVRACIVATLPKSIRVQDGSFTPDSTDSKGSRSESEALRFGFQSLRMIGGDQKSRAEAWTKEPKKDLASLSSKHCVVEPYTIGDIPARGAKAVQTADPVPLYCKLDESKMFSSTSEKILRPVVIECSAHIDFNIREQGCMRQVKLQK